VAAGSATKVAGTVVLIPLGFHLRGFQGALDGLVASELLKYLTVALGAALAGLRGIGRDALLSGAMVGISVAGFAGGQLAVARGRGNLLALAASAAGAGIPWAAVALWYLFREKAARAARGAWTATPREGS
jgi:hypothetical protein